MPFLQKRRERGSMYYGCVYKITNSLNGKSYVGQTTKKNPKKRWEHHKFESRTEKHHPLYNSMRKNGIKNFTFRVIVRCDSQQQLDNAECMCIRVLKSLQTQSGYNLELGGHGRGKVSEETRKRMSIAQKGRIFSSETKLKMSAAKKGKPSHRKGVKVSEETSKRMSESRIGRPTAKKGTKCSEEAKLKMSAAKKGKPSHRKGAVLTVEQKRKISLAKIGTKTSEETKKKLSEAAKKQWIKYHSLKQLNKEVLINEHGCNIGQN
jgi:group I intron endonuclease